MPTNLPGDALKAQMDFESAKTTSEKITKLKVLIKLIPKHKGTSKLLSGLKRKMKKLREKESAEKLSKSGRRSINVKKDGAAQICLLGFPNSGKSFFLNHFTNAQVDSTEIPYETDEPCVGMHEYGGVKLQLVEIPSTAGDMDPELLSVVRNCDLILIIGKESGQAKKISKILEGANIRLNKKAKRVKIIRKPKGGIVVSGSKNLSGDADEVKGLLRSNGFHNAEILFYEKTSIEDLEDFLEESTVYKKCLVLKNGKFKTKIPSVENPDLLMDKIWEMLELIRVFTKEPGENKADDPLVVRKGSTIKKVGMKIHKDFVKKIRFARVWGRSAKFDSQMVGLSHKVEDGDVVEFHLR
jgi:ribosome-interacting GTPase 1